MRNSCLVRCSQCARYLYADIQRFMNSHGRAPQALAQRLAFDQLGGDVMRVFRLPDLINGDDVRMIQRQDGASLLLEATHSLLIFGEKAGQPFERDFTTHPGVVSEVHFAHPAGAQMLDDLIVADALSDG